MLSTCLWTRKDTVEVFNGFLRLTKSKAGWWLDLLTSFAFHVWTDSLKT